MLSQSCFSALSYRLLSRLALAGSLLLLPSFTEPAAFSQTRYTMNAFLRCTHDDAIIQAFNLMGDSRGEVSLDKIVNKPVHVIFKDLKTMHKSLKNYDALSWISTQGEQVIFINDKHRKAPPEALAALISHEAMHDDQYNSLNEEVQSWRHEAMVWMELSARNPKLAKIPAGQSALVDRENRLVTEYQQGSLEQFVRSSAGYAKLPETSPGFSVSHAKQKHSGENLPQTEQVSGR